MQFYLEYTAQLRRAAATARETIEFNSGATMKDVLYKVVERHGDELRRLLLDDRGGLQRSVLMFVDDEQVSPESCPPLRDGQTVTFAAPISGG